MSYITSTRLFLPRILSPTKCVQKIQQYEPHSYVLCSSGSISSSVNSLLCWACPHWSLLSVSYHLETATTLALISSNHLLDIIVQGLFLRSYLSHDHLNQPPPVIDRRYIFIEQAGCIPSISPSLFPLVAVLVWPLLFSVASLAYLGATFFEICAQGTHLTIYQALPFTLSGHKGRDGDSPQHRPKQ